MPLKLQRALKSAGARSNTQNVCQACIVITMTSSIVAMPKATGDCNQSHLRTGLTKLDFGLGAAMTKRFDMGQSVHINVE
jgi:hypothetical protein